MPELIRSQLLEKIPNLVHAFTTREFGGSTARATSVSKFGSSHLLTLNQVHSNKVVKITEDLVKDLENNNLLLEGDALITNQPKILLGIRTADCLPLLVADPVNQACGAIHAGWRGLVAGVIENTINELKINFNSRVSDLLVTLGISICENCFEVGPEVVEAFKKRFGEKYNPKKGNGDRSFISLRGAAVLELLNLGFKKENIELITGCTSCNNDKMFSYRKGDVEGRQLSVIGVAD